MEKQVNVVGAGTAGLLLAGIVAKNWIEVNVYDRKKIPAYPPSASGILSIKGLDSTGIDYKKAVINTLYGARIHAGSKTLFVSSKEPKAHVVDRILLNKAYMDFAKKNGAKIVLGKQISEKDLEEMKQGIIVGADGALSTVSRYFRMGYVKKYVVTYRAEYISNNDEKSVDIYLDPEVAPGFFAWICPLSKRKIEAGIGIESMGNARSAFEKFINKYAGWLNEKRQTGAYASIIPLISRKKIVDEKNRVLLVGDAAGQVKASTGGGVVLGSKGAMLAARAIVENISRNTSLEAYEKQFRKRFGMDMRLHELIHSFYADSSEKMLEFKIGILKKLGIEKVLSRHGDMDSPTVMLKSLIGINRL